MIPPGALTGRIPAAPPGRNEIRETKKDRHAHLPMSGTAYERLLAALESVVKVSQHRDGSARAQCPAHNSRGLSLLVSRRDNGAGLHCFAGCETAAVLASVGLSLRDLFDGDDWKHNRTWAPRPAPSPIGEPEHWCDRAMQQQRLDADPDWQARLAAELKAATAARPGDFEGAGHE